MSSAPSPTGSPVPKRVKAEETAAAPAVPPAALVQPAASTSTANQKAIANQNKRFLQGKGKRKRNKHVLPDPYSPGDILYHDVVDFLGKEYVDEVLARGDGSEWEAPSNLEPMSIVELTPGAMTVSGEPRLSVADPR